MISDDPVIDYMVMEAVFIKVGREAENAQREHARKEFKNDVSSLDRFR